MKNNKSKKGKVISILLYIQITLFLISNSVSIFIETKKETTSDRFKMFTVPFIKTIQQSLSQREEYRKRREKEKAEQERIAKQEEERKIAEEKKQQEEKEKLNSLISDYIELLDHLGEYTIDNDKKVITINLKNYDAIPHLSFNMAWSISGLTYRKWEKIEPRLNQLSKDTNMSVILITDLPEHRELYNVSRGHVISDYITETYNQRVRQYDMHTSYFMQILDDIERIPDEYNNVIIRIYIDGNKFNREIKSGNLTHEDMFRTFNILAGKMYDEGRHKFTILSIQEQKETINWLINTPHTIQPIILNPDYTYEESDEFWEYDSNTQNYIKR